MYVVIVYDISVDRVNKVRKFLRQYLIWRQNSVFEGDLTPAEFMKIKEELKNMIVEDEDHIIFYKFRDKKFVQEEELGKSKVDIDNII